MLKILIYQIQLKWKLLEKMWCQILHICLVIEKGQKMRGARELQSTSLHMMLVLGEYIPGERKETRRQKFVIKQSGAERIRQLAILEVFEVSRLLEEGNHPGAVCSHR